MRRLKTKLKTKLRNMLNAITKEEGNSFLRKNISLATLTKERFPCQRKSKLSTRGDGPSKSS